MPFASHFGGGLSTPAAVLVGLLSFVAGVAVLSILGLEGSLAGVLAGAVAVVGLWSVDLGARARHR